jgi:hypothetical protein
LESEKEESGKGGKRKWRKAEMEKHESLPEIHDVHTHKAIR